MTDESVDFSCILRHTGGNGYLSYVDIFKSMILFEILDWSAALFIIFMLISLAKN